MRARIQFDKDYDVDKIDDICEEYNETDLWYRDREVRFKGSDKRLDAFLNEISKISQPIKIKRY